MIDHPFLSIWTASALIVLIAAGLAALGSTRPGPGQRPPIRRAAGRTPPTAAEYAAQGGIPTPRLAPDTTTVPTGIHIPTDKHRQQHAEEIRAAIGCTCNPSLRGATTMEQISLNGPNRVHLIPARNEQHAAHTVATEYEISYLTSQLDEGTGTIAEATTSLLFVGPTAEDDAYAVADLIGGGNLAQWAMRTRTVETTITRSPWLDVAATEQHPLTPALDMPHRIENGVCTACEAEVIQYGSDQS